mgnify:FL=1|jgi:hypothetical protein
MTTNVFSIIPSHKIMACDSRWSYETDKFLYYIDDSGYDKIIFNGVIVAVFAGKANVIELFKKWISSGCKDTIPNPNGISIIAYNTLTDEPFTRNHSFTYPSNKNPQVLFSGSGAFDAMRSWEKCNDCIKSVENACLTDVYTGGSVKFLNVLSLEHNILNEQTQLSDLFDLLKERGFVMRKHAKQLNTIAEPIKTAMNDPEILKDVNVFSSGEASFEAPAPEAMIEWQENEIQELLDFFQSCNK